MCVCVSFSLSLSLSLCYSLSHFVSHSYLLFFSLWLIYIYHLIKRENLNWKQFTITLKSKKCFCHDVICHINIFSCQTLCWLCLHLNCTVCSVRATLLWFLFEVKMFLSLCQCWWAGRMSSVTVWAVGPVFVVVLRCITPFWLMTCRPSVCCWTQVRSHDLHDNTQWLTDVHSSTAQQWPNVMSLLFIQLLY